MGKFKEGDTVRVRSGHVYWGGIWRVSSVMERPPLAYVKQLDGDHEGYIEQGSIERVDQRWQAGEHLSSCKRYVEQRANGEPIYSFYVTRPEWKRESTECGCGGRCAQNSESELNKQMTLF
jgi:hypothetical protein